MHSSLSVDLIQHHLDRCLVFLLPYHSMLNDHLTSYFTSDLWSKNVSRNVQSEIKSSSHAKTAKNIFWQQLEEKTDSGKHEGFNGFREFISDARKHSIDSLKELWLTPEQYKSQGHGEVNGTKTIGGFMNQKKHHEVNL